MPKKEKTENVKMKLSVIKLVRENKKKTGVNIAFFFEQAALEKLKTQNNGIR